MRAAAELTTSELSIQNRLGLPALSLGVALIVIDMSVIDLVIPTLTITDGQLAYQRKTEQIRREAALDGLYVIRTTLPAQRLGAAAAVRAYTQLKLAERAFRTMKPTTRRPRSTPVSPRRPVNSACRPTARQPRPPIDHQHAPAKRFATAC